MLGKLKKLLQNANEAVIVDIYGSPGHLSVSSSKGGPMINQAALRKYERSLFPFIKFVRAS